MEIQVCFFIKNGFYWIFCAEKMYSGPIKGSAENVLSFSSQISKIRVAVWQYLRRNGISDIKRIFNAYNLSEDEESLY